MLVIFLARFGVQRSWEINRGMRGRVRGGGVIVCLCSSIHNRRNEQAIVRELCFLMFFQWI